MSNDLPVEFLFINDIISGGANPCSFNLPTCRHASRPMDISVTMSAYFFWISCVAANGLPNCLRSRQYARETDKHASAAPKAPHAIPYRAWFKQPKGPKKVTVINHDDYRDNYFDRRIPYIAAK